MCTPTKTEIKFDDERTVYAIIKAAVRQALGTHNIVPAIDFNQDVNFASFQSAPPKSGTSSADRDYAQFKTFDKKQDAGQWEKLYEGLRQDISKEEEENSQMEIHPEAQSTITLGSAANSPEAITHASRGHKAYFQIHQQYIATHVKSGLMMIAQQEAHERILYEKFLLQLQQRSGASQQSLFPQSLELSPGDFSLVNDIKEELNAIGFEFSDFGNNAIVINGVPADLKTVNEKVLFEGFIEQFKQNKSELSMSNDENIARAIAKRSSIKRGNELTQGEMSSLIDQLFACRTPNYSPSGRKTTFILELEKINQFFN